MQRTVRGDLIPGYTKGLHIIVDTNTSPIRKMLPKDVKMEEASLAELVQADPHTLMNYVQKRMQEDKCVVVFLALDSKRAEADLSELPPRTTPATKLRDLIPPMLFESVDSVAYIVNHTDMVLVLKHNWLSADVYLFDMKEE